MEWIKNFIRRIVKEETEEFRTYVAINEYYNWNRQNKDVSHAEMLLKIQDVESKYKTGPVIFHAFTQFGEK